jgi:hypothetical protein
MPRSWSVSPTFSSNSFKVWESYIKVFDPFWVDFYTGWEIGINFNLLYVDTQCSQHQLLKRPSLFSMHFWHFYQESIGYNCMSFFLDVLSNSIGLCIFVLCQCYAVFVTMALLCSLSDTSIIALFHSRLPWLSGVFCVSIWILEIFLFLWEMLFNFYTFCLFLIIF